MAIVRGHDRMSECSTYFIDHVDDSLDMRLVYASQHIIKYQNGSGWTVPKRQCKEDAKPERIQVRLAKIRLRWRVVPAKVAQV